MSGIDARMAYTTSSAPLLGQGRCLGPTAYDGRRKAEAYGCFSVFDPKID